MMLTLHLKGKAIQKTIRRLALIHAQVAEATHSEEKLRHPLSKQHTPASTFPPVYSGYEPGSRHSGKPLNGRRPGVILIMQFHSEAM